MIYLLRYLCLNKQNFFLMTSMNKFKIKKQRDICWLLLCQACFKFSFTNKIYFICWSTIYSHLQVVSCRWSIVCLCERELNPSFPPTPPLCRWLLDVHLQIHICSVVLFKVFFINYGGNIIYNSFPIYCRRWPSA